MAGLIILLPWQTRLIIDNNRLAYNTPSIYLTDLIIAALLVLGFVKYQGLEETNKFRRFFFWPLWFLLILSSFHIYFALDKIFLLWACARLFLGIGLFWLIVNFKFPSKFLTKFFIIGAVLSSLLALGQFFSQAAPANKWLGLASHAAANLGDSVIEINHNNFNERWLRAYGSFDHPNILGGYLALAIIIAIYFYIKSDSQDKLFALISLIPLSAGLFVSFSRSGCLALFIGLIVFSILNIKNIKKISSPLVVIVLTIFTLSINYGYLYLPRFYLNTRLENKSLDERSLYVQEAKTLIKKAPIVGHGLGNYTAALIKAFPHKQSYDYQPVHNFWLLIMAELGCLGLGLMFWFFSLFFIAIFKIIKKEPILASFSLSLLSVILVITFFDHWLWSLHIGIITLFFVSGLVLKNLANNGQI